ncbi:hypothetical protein M427DRAFT_62363 [Gonapodya prolifera JEL478]|uniref:Uncharacterized protein n=1 Tax=Gonapodya prolifera (strain JEL478) TaxID=1344416 RepID=A0A139A0T6_GONPJ|nr:hypothetical protein M427DRAFT_62360 [Gonapodya prolifera JEL478]KXS10390.1 hypothetical protein M427DRAFT_62363 [Gonapodya prolifera JEL478]|eukprot:KXS10388.1 hypothetical protein M427DRAFT_62360 [Gonapodya prolifera JEL478]
MFLLQTSAMPVVVSLADVSGSQFYISLEGLVQTIETGGDETGEDGGVDGVLMFYSPSIPQTFYPLVHAAARVRSAERSGRRLPVVLVSNEFGPSPHSEKDTSYGTHVFESRFTDMDGHFPVYVRREGANKEPESRRDGDAANLAAPILHVASLRLKGSGGGSTVAGRMVTQRPRLDSGVQITDDDAPDEECSEDKAEVGHFVPDDIPAVVLGAPEYALSSLGGAMQWLEGGAFTREEGTNSE